VINEGMLHVKSYNFSAPGVADDLQ
jgi:hypothetical protein